MPNPFNFSTQYNFDATDGGMGTPTPQSSRSLTHTLPTSTPTTTSSLPLSQSSSTPLMPTSRADPLTTSVMPIPFSTNTTPSPRTTDPIDTLKGWGDRVATKLNLIPAQYSDLHQLVELSKHKPVADIKLALWPIALQYQMLNKIEQAKLEYDKFSALHEDLKSLFEQNFKLNRAQIDHVIRTAKDIIFQPNRTSYMNLHLDIKVSLASIL
ncbi:hypothetical protein EW146_g3216 [Bondarzewia mesenterica]|uniref:Uncharacterized protein n=1 Tax=Bondarzewia mesenterica TaxID=1095465 RepID=A0A4S4LY84_9AGAM|nr:hypothetical protein EW146_g3216 [Bondarzewia mesenterica]